MGKGSSGKKAGTAAKKNRMMYKAQGRCTVNKLKKAKKEQKRNERLLLKGKGPLVVRERKDEIQSSKT
jgi:hypothetical protein